MQEAMRRTTAIGTIFCSVTSPHGRNTVGIVALELVRTAGIIAADLIGALRPVDSVVAVILSVAKPSRCDAFPVAAAES